MCQLAGLLLPFSFFFFFQGGRILLFDHTLQGPCTANTPHPPPALNRLQTFQPSRHPSFRYRFYPMRFALNVSNVDK